MSDDERKTKQLIARIDAALGTNAKMQDELLAIKRGLEGKNPVGEIFQHFADNWQRRYGAKYEFTGAVDGNHIKRLLKVFDSTTLKARITRFFLDDDTWLQKNKHSFNVFVGRVNNYATADRGGADAVGFEMDAAPVVGCTHTPACRTDAEHTRKRMADMRR